MLYSIQKYEDGIVWCVEYITEDGAGTAWEPVDPEDEMVVSSPPDVSIRDVLIRQLADQ